MDESEDESKDEEIPRRFCIGVVYTGAENCLRRVFLNQQIICFVDLDSSKVEDSKTSVYTHMFHLSVSSHTILSQCDISHCVFSCIMCILYFL